MICIPIIAGEGGSDNAKKLEKGLAGLSRRGPCGPMRGAGAPLHSPFFSLYRGAGGGTLASLRGAGAPLHSPMWEHSSRSKSSDLASAPTRRALRPSAPGDFPAAGKVTKGAPEPTVLDSLGAEPSPSLVLRCACTRATFCHKNRPICHFGLVGKSVLFFPLVLSRKHSLFSIRSSAGALASRMLEGLSSRNQYR